MLAMSEDVVCLQVASHAMKVFGRDGDSRSSHHRIHLELRLRHALIAVTLNAY